jgi:hypothetical protein
LREVTKNKEQKSLAIKANAKKKDQIDADEAHLQLNLEPLLKHRGGR